MHNTITTVLLLLVSGSAAAHQPHITKPQQASAIEFPGHLTRVLASHSATLAQAAVLELELPSRTFGAPPHVHSNEDEYFYVLEGEVDFLDRGNVIRAETGSLVVLPRGYLHGFWNDTDLPSRLLLIISPGHFADFFDDVVAQIRSTHADDPKVISKLIADAAAKRGVEIHFDKVPASAVHLLAK
jgi:quercetin dioxygenase-like cupin family protein